MQRNNRMLLVLYVLFHILSKNLNKEKVEVSSPINSLLDNQIIEMKVQILSLYDTGSEKY
jgi:hypothetical protein